MPVDRNGLPLSFFGGTPLQHFAELDQPLIDKLSDLDVYDAEQLLGMIRDEETKAHLAEYLGISSEAIDQMVREIDTVLPQESRSFAQEQYQTGAFEPTDETSSITRSFAQPTLPTAYATTGLPNRIVHPSSRFWGIQHQRSRGTCVAFAAAAMTEFYWRTEGVKSKDTKLSEQFLYCQCKKLQEDKAIGRPKNCGTWLVLARDVISDDGVCVDGDHWWGDWRYNPSPPCNQPASWLALKFGREWGIYSRTRAHMINPKDVMGIKLALAQPNAVAFSFPVFKSWMNPMSRTHKSGQITMRVGGEPVFGGHAVCLVGYQDLVLGSNTSGFFIFRNSWGEDWAKESLYGQGCGTISYEYVRNYGWEALAVR